MAAPLEPWSSSLNVLSASQQLQNAIHAKNYKDIKKYLNSCRYHLKHVHGYLISGSQLYPNEMNNYNNLANTVNNHMSNLKTISNNVPKKNYQKYQNTTLNNFQNGLRELYTNINNLHQTPIGQAINPANIANNLNPTNIANNLNPANIANKVAPLNYANPFNNANPFRFFNPPVHKF